MSTQIVHRQEYTDSTRTGLHRQYTDRNTQTQHRQEYTHSPQYAAKSLWNSRKLISYARVIFSINLSHGFTPIPHLDPAK
jgi:hypothetical protein